MRCLFMSKIVTGGIYIYIYKLIARTSRFFYSIIIITGLNNEFGAPTKLFLDLYLKILSTWVKPLFFFVYEVIFSIIRIAYEIVWNFQFDNCNEVCILFRNFSLILIDPIFSRNSRSNPDVARIDGRQSCGGHRLPPSGFSIGKSICYLSCVRVVHSFSTYTAAKPLDDVIEFLRWYTMPNALLPRSSFLDMEKTTWLKLLIDNWLKIFYQ